MAGVPPVLLVEVPPLPPGALVVPPVVPVSVFVPPLGPLVVPPLLVPPLLVATLVELAPPLLELVPPVLLAELLEVPPEGDVVAPALEPAPPVSIVLEPALAEDALDAVLERAPPLPPLLVAPVWPAPPEAPELDVLSVEELHAGISASNVVSRLGKMRVEMGSPVRMKSSGGRGRSLRIGGLRRRIRPKNQTRKR
jgi:hypothetical protein